MRDKGLEDFAIINFGSPLIGRVFSGFTHKRSLIFLGRGGRDRFGKGLE
jgi:hypothetical protein